MTWRLRHLFVIVLITALVGIGAALITANRSAALAEEARREADRRWCGVVVALDQAYRESPPQTPAGQQIAESIAALRRDFHCP